MRVALPLALSLALPALASGDVQVRPRGERLDLEASAAPLADVLARLAQQTGMKVVYEGTPPRQPITATLLDRTPLEAVLGVMEGLGLNYALRVDRTGTRVETLLMAGASSGAPSRPAPPPVSQAPPPAARATEAAEPDANEDEETADPNAGPPGAPQRQRPQGAAPQPSAPPSFSGPLPPAGSPGSPFGTQVGPLTLPTPAPPTPSPTPSPPQG